MFCTTTEKYYPEYLCFLDLRVTQQLITHKDVYEDMKTHSDTDSEVQWGYVGD